MVATIILLIMLGVEFGIHLVKHNEPRYDRYNAWVALLDIAITLVLYYYAGLFDNFH
jgi:hypothetical protein